MALKVSNGWVDAAPGIAAFAVVSVVAVSGGGFFPRTWRLSLLALGALSLGALIARDRIALSRREWGVVAALGALAAWTAASAYWSSRPPESLLESERAFLYVVGMMTALLGVAPGALPKLLMGAVGGVTAISGYALGKHLLSPPPLNPFQGALLFEPFGYANAVGIYVVLGIVLTIGLALWARSRAARSAALAPLVVLVPTLYFSSSRGAWVALPVGLLVLLYVGRWIRSRGVLLALLGAGIAIGLVVGSEKGQGFSFFGENRPHYWRAAWKDFEANPLLGSGAGTFGDFWLHHRSIPEFVHDAHSLYLESLAELGPLGLALVVIALGLPLVALRGPHDPLIAAAAGGYVAFLFHSAADWDWEFPALTLTGLLCAAAVLVGTRPERALEISMRVRVALLVAAFLVLVFALVRLEAAGQLGWQA